MEYVVLALLAGVMAMVLKRRAQQRRVVLLAGLLQRYQIEKLMEQLMQGYPRAAAEADQNRSMQVFALLESAENSLCSQFAQFAASFADEVKEEDARTGIGGFGIAALAAALPSDGFDARKAFLIHAQGLRMASQHHADDSLQQRKQQAYAMSAELLLMQHTCHWYCRSRHVASARLMMRHQTSYEQVLQHVMPATSAAYRALLQAG